MAIRRCTFAASDQDLQVMKTETYADLFHAFGKAPMEGFMGILFSPLNEEQRQSLMLEDVSYHRYNADLVSLEAWMCVAPFENNQWIWARVELNEKTGKVEQEFFTKDSYCQQSLPSLDACIDYYSEKIVGAVED